MHLLYKRIMFCIFLLIGLAVMSEIKEERGRLQLRKTGYTHFVHIPFDNWCKQAYDAIQSELREEDRQWLVDINSLHATILVFRLQNLDDIILWKKIILSFPFSKTEISIGGMGFFSQIFQPEKAQVLYINVKGLDDIIHHIVSEAIKNKILKKQELSHIYFNKQTQRYQAGQQHLTILKTKGNSSIDTTSYIQKFSNITIGNVPISDIRLSIIGSYDKKYGDYFNEFIVQAEK